MSAKVQQILQTTKQNDKKMQIINSHWTLNGKTYPELHENEKKDFAQALEVKRYNQCLPAGIIAKDYLHLLSIRMAENAFAPTPKTEKFYPDVEKILAFVNKRFRFECEEDECFTIEDEAYEGCYFSVDIEVSSDGKIEVYNIQATNEDNKKGTFLPRHLKKIEQEIRYNLWIADNRNDSLNGYQLGE